MNWEMFYYKRLQVEKSWKMFKQTENLFIIFKTNSTSLPMK